MISKQICLIILLVKLVMSQKIVDVYDTVKIKTRNDTHLQTFKLQALPYITDVRSTCGEFCTVH